MILDAWMKLMDGFFMPVMILIPVINYTPITSLMFQIIVKCSNGVCRTYREKKIQQGKRTRETVTTRIARYSIK
jgi:hypothetical protein